MKIKPKSIALLGICAAIAMVLSYIESLIPLSFAVPGIKLGLANIAVIFALYKLGAKEAVAVSLVRIAWMAILFGNVMTLAYSVAGAALSLTAMILLKRWDRFSIRWSQRYRRNTAQHRSDTRCNAHQGNRSDRVLPPDSLRQRHSCGRGCRDSFRDTRKACSGQQRMTLAQTSAQFEKSDDIQLLLHNTWIKTSTSNSLWRCIF